MDYATLRPLARFRKPFYIFANKSARLAGRFQRIAEPSSSDEGMTMSRTLHIAAAAKQLNRKLFDSTHLEGCVTVGDNQLDVVVHGAWTRNKLGNFAGYAISWHELPVAA
jgi:hypothetical protein